MLRTLKGSGRYTNFVTNDDPFTNNCLFFNNQSTILQKPLRNYFLILNFLNLTTSTDILMPSNKITELQSTHSLANRFLSELRDVTIQRDSMRFRKNLERLGEIMAYEISKSFHYQAVEVQTPLAIAKVPLYLHSPVLISILRAGVPFFQGLLNFFDDAECGFIGAYRRSEGTDPVEINLDYKSMPNLEDKMVILADPMLATGNSFITAYHQLEHYGVPKKVHVAAVIASNRGIENLRDNLPEGTEIWVGVVDEELNEHSYIVPGLGDAGDLAYGEKL